MAAAMALRGLGLVVEQEKVYIVFCFLSETYLYVFTVV